MRTFLLLCLLTFALWLGFCPHWAAVASRQKIESMPWKALFWTPRDRLDVSVLPYAQFLRHAQPFVEAQKGRTGIFYASAVFFDKPSGFSPNYSIPKEWVVVVFRPGEYVVCAKATPEMPAKLMLQALPDGYTHAQRRDVVVSAPRGIDAEQEISRCAWL